MWRRSGVESHSNSQGRGFKSLSVIADFESAHKNLCWKKNVPCSFRILRSSCLKKGKTYPLWRYLSDWYLFEDGSPHKRWWSLHLSAKATCRSSQWCRPGLLGIQLWSKQDILGNVLLTMVHNLTLISYRSVTAIQRDLEAARPSCTCFAAFTKRINRCF